MKTTATTKVKDNTLKMNQIALKATEQLVLKTINSAENLQSKTSKTLKSSFDYTEKQQDIFFTRLEKGKGMIWKNLNKTLDFFSRN